MGRNFTPRFKQCRRLGVNVCGHPKAMKRAGSPAFAKRKKPTEYSKQLQRSRSSRLIMVYLRDSFTTTMRRLLRAI